MPELPEVETVVRDLRPLVIGRTIASIIVGRKTLRRKWSRCWDANVTGARIHEIQRRGKWILVALATGWLVVHLGMTGQFTVANGQRESHTHFVFCLDDGSELRFRDVRRFGSVQFLPRRDLVDQFFAQTGLGPEPFDLNPVYWYDSLRSTLRNLKAILLDQTVVAGVGNIYADESLHEAKLHPTLLGKAISRPKAEALRRAIIAVLTRAIARRGSSIRDYIGGSGLKGEMQNEFRVYGRTGEPCLACGSAIVRIVLAGRSTHFCPKCQRKRA